MCRKILEARRGLFKRGPSLTSPAASQGVAAREVATSLCAVICRVSRVSLRSCCWRCRAQLCRAAMSKDACAAHNNHKTNRCDAHRQCFVAPAGRYCPTSCSPAARCVIRRCRVRRGDLTPRHVTGFARVLLCFCGLRRRGLRCCAAPQGPKMPARRAQVAHRCPGTPPATPRCPAVRYRPTSLLPVARGVAGRRRARHCDIAARHSTARVSLRPCGL